MKRDWKLAVLGGFAGAAIAVAMLGAAFAGGLIPNSGERAHTEKIVHDYLLKNPEIVVAMMNALDSKRTASQDQSRQEAVTKLGMKAFFDPNVAFIVGPKDAKTTFVEFFDYNCPFCRASHPGVEAFFKEHPNARYAFVEFPIKGPDSTLASRAAIAARNQPDKYLKLHFALMTEKDKVDAAKVFEVAKAAGLDIAKLKRDMNDPSVDAKIAAAHKLAEAAQIDGTPAFIVNGIVREGAVDDTMLTDMAKKANPS